MVDKIPDGSDVIFYFFRKRKCFSYQAWYSLSQCKVKALYMIGFSSFFANSFMPFRRKNFCVWWPEISITYSTLAINRRWWIPKAFCSCYIPAPDIYSDNFFGISVNSKPYPLSVLFVTDKRPHFIALNCQAAFFFTISIFWGMFSYFSLIYFCSHGSLMSRTLEIPAIGIFSRSILSTDSHVFFEITFFVRFSINWRPQSLHRYFDFPLWIEPFFITLAELHHYNDDFDGLLRIEDFFNCGWRDVFCRCYHLWKPPAVWRGRHY